MFTPEQKSALAAPLDKANVASREQAGRKLSYIEGWHAIAEANRIFGFDTWDRQTVDLTLLGEPRVGKDKFGNDQWRVGYSCRVRITVRAGETTIVREGCGFGSGIDKDVDQAHESALKEAETDAMKRALMTFGNPFGLALYDKTQANVAAAPPPEPEMSAAVAAASVAIGLCGDEPTLTRWSATNAEMIAKLDRDDKAEVRRLYGMRLEALRKSAPKTAEADPFSEAA
jgi:DNA repair and recombination protein RAD52